LFLREMDLRIGAEQRVLFLEFVGVEGYSVLRKV